MGEPIAQATALLSTLMHCRKQALELQSCRRGSSAGDCARQEAAFTTCSNEHLPAVIGHLVKIADRYCKDEVSDLQRCRYNNPGADCESEDMQAMRCASLHVLASARAPPSR